MNVLTDRSIKMKMPETLGHKRNAAHVLRENASRKRKPPMVEITNFDDVIEDMKVSFDICLTNYGSGKASWVLCDILAMDNRLAQRVEMYFLWGSESANVHDKQALAKAWHEFNKEQRELINDEVDKYIKYLAEYVKNDF